MIQHVSGIKLEDVGSIIYIYIYICIMVLVGAESDKLEMPPDIKAVALSSGLC